MKKLHSFTYCLNIANNEHKMKHLMLGNGFSISLFPKIFNYQRLAEKITNDTLKELFKKMETNDFEYVMRRLTHALWVLRCYPENEIEKLHNIIEKDLDELKKTLIEVITLTHPPKPDSITENQYQSCYTFLKHFDDGRKYTFNYDLILYWVYMHFLKENNPNTFLKMDDGFRKDNASYITWEIGNEIEQNLYYIHGAMHIFSDGINIEKYSWKNTGICLSEQVRTSINNKKYPVFITEGTLEHKKQRINTNAYLGRSFSSLKNIGGNLFIFGHSLRDEDDHVFDAINKNRNLKNIFISIYGDIGSKENKKITEKVESWKTPYNNKKYYFYDATSANVWTNTIDQPN